LGEWQEDTLGSGPQQGAEHQELGQLLQRSIARLGEPYRSLVVLRDVQQNSYEEVAEALELTLAQVKVYLHRARKQLREELAEVRP
jgi:RNA polymerase sigma-70 factor (ECF subfamily)